jgi:hypothetical protein
MQSRVGYEDKLFSLDERIGSEIKTQDDLRVLQEKFGNQLVSIREPNGLEKQVPLSRLEFVRGK